MNKPLWVGKEKKSFWGKDINDCWFYLIFFITIGILALTLKIW